MKFSEQWLKSWFKSSLDEVDCRARLDAAGIEVEHVESMALPFEGVFVGQILQVKPHPNADRLHCCEVSLGSGSEPHWIVCGAQNVRPGIKVAVASVGATLPFGLKIKKARIRGVDSQGMLCSSTELGLNKAVVLGDEEGILVLPDSAPLGQRVDDLLALDDKIWTVQLTPNRGDCLSILGLARELSAVLDQPWSYPFDCLKHSEDNARSEQAIQLGSVDRARCPDYRLAVLHHPDCGIPTPTFMKQRLERSGLHPVNRAVVDITQYVMLELGQPLHVFDLDCIKGPVDVRLAQTGDTIHLLNGQKLPCQSGTLLIADAEKPLALAGLMGSVDSAVTDNTGALVLESAHFTPSALAGQARRYGLSTEAAYRFERGVSPDLVQMALDRAIDLYAEILGADCVYVSLGCDPEGRQSLRPRIPFRPAYVNQVLGTAFSTAQCLSVLKRLGMQIQPADASDQPELWFVTPPLYRFDLGLEIDLVEEVIRLMGYHEIPEVSVNHSVSQDQLARVLCKKNEDCAEHLVALGYHEVVTYSFVNPKIQDLIDPDRHPSVIANPLSADCSEMRTSLWPGLLSVASYHQHRHIVDLRLFEQGTRFSEGQEAVVVSGLLSGSAYGLQWALEKRDVDFYDMKATLEHLRERTGACNRFDFVPLGDHPALHPGLSAEIHDQGLCIGLAGALHPRLKTVLGIKEPVYLFECLRSVFSIKKTPVYQEVSKFPGVIRDLSVIIDKSCSVDRILKASNQSLPADLVERVTVLDVYQGPVLDASKKAVTLRVQFQALDRTLLDADIKAIMKNWIEILKQMFAVELRV